MSRLADIRTSAGLTSAGTQLTLDAKPLLADADVLRRNVARAACGRATFTIGFMPGLIVTGSARALGDAHLSLTVEVLRTGWDNQDLLVSSGDVELLAVEGKVADLLGQRMHRRGNYL